MNMSFVIFSVFSIVLLICWATNREYKKRKRKCRRPGCNCEYVQRIGKILLPRDYNQEFSMWSPEGKLCWFTPAVKLTFTMCECGCDLVKHEVGTLDAVHGYRVKFLQPQQFYLDGQQFVSAAKVHLQKLGVVFPEKNAEPVTLYSLFEKLFEQESGTQKERRLL